MHRASGLSPRAALAPISQSPYSPRSRAPLAGFAVGASAVQDDLVI